MAAVKRDWYGKVLGIVRRATLPVFEGNKLVGTDHVVAIPVAITEAATDKTHLNRRIWVRLSPEDALQHAEQIRVAALDAIRAREEV